MKWYDNFALHLFAFTYINVKHSNYNIFADSFSSSLRIKLS